MEKQDEIKGDLTREMESKITEISSNINKQIKEDIQIDRLQTQLKGVLIELEDLRNRSMRSNLVFKGIREEAGGENNWEATSQVLADFITNNLGLPYTDHQIDMQISRAHRTNDKKNNHKNKKDPRPIIAQFVNWRIAEEVRNKVIQLNAANKLQNVYVNQMFSKDLTERRNNALIKRKEHIKEHPNLQIKLDFPATLKYRERGSNSKWLVLGEY